MKVKTASSTAVCAALLTIASVSMAQDAGGWNENTRLSDTANGRGTLRTNRGTESIKQAFCELGSNYRASIWVDAGGNKWSVAAQYEMTTGQSARLKFNLNGLSGTGMVTFRNNHLISMNFSGRNNGGNFSADFTSTENNNGGGGWGGGGGNGGNWGDHNGWGNGNWNGNSIIDQWSGTRDGRGPVELQGRFKENWSRATVNVQRDRDTFIKINRGGQGYTLRGKARKEGNMLIIDIRDAFGERQANGTAKVYLSKKYGEFYKITMSGTAGGRRFTGTFDDWN